MPIDQGVSEAVNSSTTDKWQIGRNLEVRATKGLTRCPQRSQSRFLNGAAHSLFLEKIELGNICNQVTRDGTLY